LEFRVIRPDGITRYIHKRGETECVDQKAVRLVGTIQDITEQKKAENQIILCRQKLRTLAAKMEMIEEQERRRIASDLHDSVGQILAFATRELKYMRKSMPRKEADSLLEIAEQLDKAVVQTRTLSFDLSPSILYDIGFEIAVEDLLEKFSNERKIEYEFENDEKNKPLTIPLKVLLYRSIRELLMNIAKHAKATIVKVSLLRADTDIEVIVEDDGKGFDVAEVESSEKGKGFGLFNIRERIEHLGGKFHIESAKGKGTKIKITVPLSLQALQ
jgi:signal transduction histidine kinase